MNALGYAHAKVILLGEHFVVPFTDADGREHPGTTALAMPLPGLRTQVRLSAHESVSCEIDERARKLGFDDNASGLMEQALRFAAGRFRWNLGERPLRAHSESNFPCSRGLGSSASFSVALTRAFLQLAGTGAPDLHAEAQAIENLFHGKSSGLDTSAILSDEAILYRSGEVLKTFAPVAVDVVVADSGPRATSASLVGKTQEIRRRNPDRWLSLGTRVNELVRACLEAIEKKNGAAEVARTVRDSQGILSEIGLMNAQLADLLSIGEKSGALAGKVSGAGAGGIALFIAHPGDGLELARRMGDAGAKIIATLGSTEAAARYSS